MIACLLQLLQVLVHNVLVQKYCMWIEVAVVKIAAYNHALTRGSSLISSPRFLFSNLHRTMFR